MRIYLMKVNKSDQMLRGVCDSKYGNCCCLQNDTLSNLGAILRHVRKDIISYDLGHPSVSS